MSSGDAIVCFSESPLQLENSVRYLRQAGHAVNSSVHVLRLSGIERADAQTLRIAIDQGLNHIVLLEPRRKPQPKGGVGEVSKLLSLRGEILSSANVSRLTGPVALIRFMALVKSLLRISPSGIQLRRLGVLVTGNPGSLIPAASQFLGHRPLVVVDDGFAILEVAEKRQSLRRVSRRVGWPSVFRSPQYWKRSLTFYTVFSDLEFGPGDVVERNKTFDDLPGQVGIQEDCCWVLGHPYLGNGESTSGLYRAVLARLVQLATSRGLHPQYLPHRLENLPSLKLYCSSINLEVAEAIYSVESRILYERKIASLVVGFGSTALEYLSTLAPGDCELWNIYLGSDQAKSGADSPERIAQRLGKNPRVLSIPALSMSALSMSATKGK